LSLRAGRSRPASADHVVHVYQQSSLHCAGGLLILKIGSCGGPIGESWEAEALRDGLLAWRGRRIRNRAPGVQDVATPRRSLYLMSVRTGMKTAEFGALFDAPDCNRIVDAAANPSSPPKLCFFDERSLMTQLWPHLRARRS